MGAEDEKTPPPLTGRLRRLIDRAFDRLETLFEVGASAMVPVLTILFPVLLALISFIVIPYDLGNQRRGETDPGEGYVSIAPYMPEAGDTPDPQPETPMLHRRTPVGGLGQALDAARVFLFLVLPAASDITGQMLFVDGGYTLPRRNGRAPQQARPSVCAAAYLVRRGVAIRDGALAGWASRSMGASSAANASASKSRLRALPRPA